MSQSLKMEASTRLDGIFESVTPQSTALTVVLMAICLVSMVFLVTWLGTLIRSWPSKPGLGREPPVAPYSIPYLQHMISFLLDPYGLLQSLRYINLHSLLIYSKLRRCSNKGKISRITLYSHNDEYQVPRIQLPSHCGKDIRQISRVCL